jgi:hypothetical protein
VLPIFNKDFRLKATETLHIFVALSRQFLLTLSSRFVKNMQHINMFNYIEPRKCFLKVFLSWPNPKNKQFMKELFSARNQANSTFYHPPLLLPFGGLACFVAFWRVSLLCCLWDD